MKQTKPQLDTAADGGSQHPLVLRLRSKICDEDNDGQLLDDAVDEIQRLWNALEQFYTVNTRFGIGGFGMMEYQKANHDARQVLFPKNSVFTTCQDAEIDEETTARFLENGFPRVED